jgi:hypothetical protein
MFLAAAMVNRRFCIRPLASTLKISFPRIFCATGICNVAAKISYLAESPFLQLTTASQNGTRHRFAHLHKV